MKPIFTAAVFESSKSRSTGGQLEAGRVLRIVLDQLEHKWVPRDKAGAPRKKIFLDQRLEDRGLTEELGADDDDLRKVDAVGADFGETSWSLLRIGMRSPLGVLQPSDYKEAKLRLRTRRIAIYVIGNSDIGVTVNAESLTAGG